MKDNESAFPVFDSKNPDFACTDSGMTLRKYAAIHLKVPRSGDTEIDAMIRESRRDKFAGQALAGITYEYFSNDFNTGSAKADISQIAHCARLVADALIAELEKEAGNEKIHGL
jgi:hypothetical protein